MTAIRLLAAMGGAFLVVLAYLWGMQILTVKTAVPPLLARLAFRGVRWLMYALGKIVRSENRRQQIWALYVSLSLLAIVAIALVQILVGYALLFYGISTDDLRTSYVNSLSSLSVIGFGGLPDTLAQATLAFAESLTIPIFVALLISYLVTMNGSVSQRQSQLRSIEVQVGASRSGPELLRRALDGPGLTAMSAIWQDWTQEFVQIRATFPTVEGYLLYDSPGFHNQWVADALSVLDAASLRNSAFDLPDDPGATRCLEEGAATLAAMNAHARRPLRRTQHHWNPGAVTRSQFADACAALASADAPIAPDQDAAWSAFRAHRATYEDAIIRLGNMMDVPLPGWG